MNMDVTTVNSSLRDSTERGGGPIVVILPFDQPFLPEFESFGFFHDHGSILLTNSKDVVSHIDSKATVIDPHFILVPLSRLLLYKFCYSQDLERIVRRYRPSAVVTFELYSTLSFQVATTPLRHSFTHIVISYDTVSIKNSLWGMFPPTRFMAMIVSRRADAFIALSKRIAHALERSGVDKRKIKMAYPGVPIHELVDSCKHASSRGSSPFRILFLGRLRPNKGIETLISAFTSLRSEGISDLELVIAGNGPMADLVKQKAELTDGMCFAGLLQGEQKKRAFLDSDVFIYPSEDTVYLSRFVRWEEQTAAAVREAMSYGLPVIVSDSGSLPELVGRNDVVFRQRDIGELKEKVLMLRNSTSLRQEIGDFNLSRSRDLFPIESLAAVVEQLLQQT